MFVCPPYIVSDHNLAIYNIYVQFILQMAYFIQLRKELFEGQT